MIIQRNIELDERRCYECGRFCATEHGVSYTCPYCAERRAIERIEEMETMRRSMSALRGALTKAKARR